MRNAAELFVGRHLADGRAGRTCFRFQGRDVTYGDVAGAVRRFAGALPASPLSVRRGDRVLLLLPDSPAFATAFWGAIRMGAVAVPVNPALTPSDYAFLLDDSRAAAIVVGEAFAPALREARRLLPDGGRGLRVILDGTADEGDELPLASVLAGAPDESGAAEIGADDPAFWLYTSGTTGRPKAAIHRHGDMGACVDAFGRHVLEIAPDDRCFSVAKMFFAYGLGNSLYYPMAVGASSILHPDRFDPDEAWAIIARERPTLVFAVPTAYAAMLHAAGARTDAELREGTSSVRRWLSAGEALPVPLFERWRARTGAELLDGIGSTEMCNTFICNRAGRARPGSSGEVVPGYRARIVGDPRADAPGAPAADDAGDVDEGDLLVSGASAFAEYWNQPERTAQVKRGEWVRTGDRYRRDADGYYWYLGRSDDMIKAGALWVSPVEVEAVLLEHGAVREAGVVGWENEDQLVKPLAVVVLRDGTEESSRLADELKQFVKDRLAPYKYPRWIVFARALPRTATGKLRRFMLRDLAASGQRR